VSPLKVADSITTSAKNAFIVHARGFAFRQRVDSLAIIAKDWRC
jgi:hypothetical protein